jgi:exodeoxyribonuclease V gamma subunit
MPSDINPGLIALHSNRSETLVQTVLAWLRERPLQPLEEEVILVQSNGMAEWLKMALASEGGVCAATRVELPARFIWRTYRQVLGREQVPSHSAMDKIPLTWRLMQQLPTLQPIAGFEPIAGFLGKNDPNRLFQLASRLSDLLDQYQVYRADWLEAWAGGRDVLTCPDRRDIPVPEDQIWQPMLWRALLGTLGTEQRNSIRPHLHQRVLDALQGNDAPASPVARRVVVFGMTHVPLTMLQTLAALSRHSQVLLAIPNPCRYHWADIMDGRELLRMERRRQPLKQGRDLAALPLDQMHAHAHPLLAAWGRQGRDFVRQLDAFDDAELARLRFSIPRVDLFDEEDALDAPLLTQVQNRVRDLVPLVEHPPVTPKTTDQSIVFHITHSTLREVEVLHDQLLQMLANAPADKPLHPKDVVVMVPDVDTLAPAIRAVFGQYSRFDARYIPFDIADLHARASSPLVSAIEWLLRLPSQRVLLSELRDLLEVPSIAARFGISTDALPRLTDWMTGSGIRWGLDTPHRSNLDLEACGNQNTGWFGLQRMLLGYASGGVAEDANAKDAFAGIEPYPEVGGLEAELAGCLASFLTILVHWRQVSSTDASPSEWAIRARALLPDLVKAVDDTDREILSALDDALTRWQDACYQAQFTSEIPLAVAREAWLGTLEEPSLNKRFRAGGVTFCTLMPMRAVPFEVVCLLGMNDGDYPRRSQRSDFDLMGLPGQIRPGDRARRDDDRQLMLEALLSARRVLYVSWTGRSVRDNSEQPPSVLVSQLRDYLAAGWQGAVLKERTTEHPLQPFSRRYFEPDTPLFTYAREWRAAHVIPDAAPGGEAAPAIPAMAAFEPDPRVPLTVGQLSTFLRNPVKMFFRQRLNVSFDQTDESDNDSELFGLGGLDEYGLMKDVIKEVCSNLASLQPDAAADASLAESVAERLQSVRRSGQLPIGGMGDRTEKGLAGALLPMLGAWQSQLERHPHTRGRERLHFKQGQLILEDWLDHLHQGMDGDAVPTWLELEPGKLCSDPAKGVVRADKLVLAWVRSVVAAANHIAVKGVIVGRDATLTVDPMDQVTAQETLAMLTDVWCAGLSKPLPLALKTSLAFVDDKKPRDTYDGTFQTTAECVEPCLHRLFPDYETLSADPRFEELSRKVYGPLQKWVLSHVKAKAHATNAQALEGATA